MDPKQVIKLREEILLEVVAENFIGFEHLLVTDFEKNRRRIMQLREEARQWSNGTLTPKNWKRVEI